MDRYYDIWAPALRVFEDQYPMVADKLVDWYPSGQNEITVKTKDDDKVIFNFITGDIRSIDSKITMDNVSEERWRIEFASRLNQKMAMTGISRWQLSRMTDIPEVTLSRYMNGRSTPSMFKGILIARALRCSIEELSEFIF